MQHAEQFGRVFGRPVVGLDLAEAGRPNYHEIYMSADNPLDASGHENRLTVSGIRANYDSRAPFFKRA